MVEAVIVLEFWHGKIISPQGRLHADKTRRHVGATSGPFFIPGATFVGTIRIELIGAAANTSRIVPALEQYIRGMRPEPAPKPNSPVIRNVIAKTPVSVSIESPYGLRRE